VTQEDAWRRASLHSREFGEVDIRRQQRGGYFPNHPVDELDLRDLAPDDGHEPRRSLPERKILPAGDAKEEVGPLRRHLVKHGRPRHSGHGHYIASKMGIVGFMPRPRERRRRRWIILPTQYCRA